MRSFHHFPTHDVQVLVQDSGDVLLYPVTAQGRAALPEGSVTLDPVAARRKILELTEANPGLWVRQVNAHNRIRLV
ncbi:MAG: hypothetical protein QN204_04980 [Armatimonadota bacterium]|nr:hypothetical protein [Armatimonadota bacterium]